MALWLPHRSKTLDFFFVYSFCCALLIEQIFFSTQVFGFPQIFVSDFSTKNSPKNIGRTSSMYFFNLVNKTQISQKFCSSKNNFLHGVCVDHKLQLLNPWGVGTTYMQWPQTTSCDNLLISLNRVSGAKLLCPLGVVPETVRKLQQVFPQHLLSNYFTLETVIYQLCKIPYE